MLTFVSYGRTAWDSGVCFPSFLKLPAEFSHRTWTQTPPSFCSLISAIIYIQVKIFALASEFWWPLNKFIPTLFFTGNAGTGYYLCLDHGSPSRHLLSGFASMCLYKWVGLIRPISRLPMASARICSNKIRGDDMSCCGEWRFQKKRLHSFTYVSWVPKKKMGYLFAGGFTAPSGSSSICETEMEKGLFPNVVSFIQASPPSPGSASAGIP